MIVLFYRVIDFFCHVIAVFFHVIDLSFHVIALLGHVVTLTCFVRCSALGSDEASDLDSREICFSRVENFSRHAY